MHPAGCVNTDSVQVKCDRRVSGCSGCERLEIPCSYVDGSLPLPSVNGSDTSYTKAGIKRRRIQRACLACHEQRVKCSGDVPCWRCRQHNMACLERPSGRYRSSVSTASSAVNGPEMASHAISTISPVSSAGPLLGSTPSPAARPDLHDNPMLELVVKSIQNCW